MCVNKGAVARRANPSVEEVQELYRTGLKPETIADLRNAGYVHAVKIVEDVSMVSKGSIISIFRHPHDAKHERDRLCRVYHKAAPYAFEVVDL